MSELITAEQARKMIDVHKESLILIALNDVRKICRIIEQRAQIGFGFVVIDSKNFIGKTENVIDELVKLGFKVKNGANNENNLTISWT